MASAAPLGGESEAFARLPIDHGVAPAPIAGGATAGRKTLERFVRDRLARYAADQSHPISPERADSRRICTSAMSARTRSSLR